MSIPEPTPKNAGKIVPESLIHFINSSKLDIEAKHYGVTLIEERDQFGRRKYGQPLRTEDGRDDIEDARQELGDLLQYCWKARMNDCDLSPIRRLVPILEFILNAEEPIDKQLVGQN